MASSCGLNAGVQRKGGSLARAAPARPRLVPAAAIAPQKKAPSQPAMRPLAPTDDAVTLANLTVPKHNQPDHSGTSSGNHAAAEVVDASSASRLVPMQYRGPPAGAPQQQAAASRPAPPAATSSSGWQVAITLNSSPSGNGSSGGPVVYRARVPAATAVQGAAAAGRAELASSPTFTRGMMVAGFDESESDLPTDYQYSWAQESYSKGQRTRDTWSFVLTLRARLWLLDQAWSYGPGGKSEAARSARARALAAWIRERILQLGPTFIKLGQLFSTRSDLFPPEFTEELSKLQLRSKGGADRVPAFSADKAEAIIERELGAPVGQLFASFDRKPIAAASLGQVHRATLLTGESVVVKVQRPGLRQLFEIDLQNLEKVAEQLDKGDEATRDFKGIYQECAQVLYQEIDYIKEGRNADRFRRNFGGEPWVRVPRVYWQHSSPSILTLEYLPGIKITDTQRIVEAGLDAPTVARRATESYLIQILRHGFFHADPHPGNIAVDSAGSLIFYDFGMMGEIVPTTRERLVDLYAAVTRKDTEAVVQQLVALGIIVPTSDLLSIRRSIAYFINNVSRQAQQGEAVASIGEDLFAIAVDQPFRFPAQFTFVLRAFATLEGIGKALDPNFKFIEVAAPYAGELLELGDARSQGSLLLGQLQQQATELGQAAAAMPLRVQKMESTMALLETGDLKLRVRVLEAERAARRAGVVQAATINTICSMGMLNVGVQLGLAGQTTAAGAALALAAGCGGLVVFGFRRVQRLDKFEKSIKTGTRYDPNS